ncbi:MAG: rRNA pseudouridine synthase [Taibaiella sp.]|nr:rRNA pseudouridine synthase [Taibaiella sp.]
MEDKYDKKKDKPSYSNPFRDGGGEDKPARKRVARSDEKRPFKKEGSDQPYTPTERRKVVPPPEAVVEEPKKRRKPKHDDDDDDDYFDEKAAKKAKSDEPEIMPLNKYLAHSGVCSRREAAEVIKDGKVKVNNEVVTEPGYKVQLDDIVSMNEKKLGLQKGMVYILLNKPKDYITTNDDPQGRRTVMDLVEGADAERLFPVGRLDRMTTGLLLITNDGDLTQKMAHPSYNMKKIYQVTLDKPLTKADAEQIVAGVTLDDGVAHVDTLAYLESKNELGLEIHSGKNRIVRRIFESLGYVVEKLDRVMYAGLTKKNVPRGRWRYLTEREIVLLKHFKS